MLTKGNNWHKAPSKSFHLPPVGLTTLRGILSQQPSLIPPASTFQTFAVQIYAHKACLHAGDKEESVAA